MFVLPQKKWLESSLLWLAVFFTQNFSFMQKILFFLENGIIIKVVKKKRECFRDSRS